METTLESASDYSLAVFVGTFFAMLVVVVLLGGQDELRRGVRSLFAGTTTIESFRPGTLRDYVPPFTEDDNREEELEEEEEEEEY